VFSALCPRRKDVLLALGVAALAGLELWLNGGVRPLWAATSTEVPAALALAWRRRFPLVTVAFVAAALSAEVLLGVPVEQPVVPLVALVIALYSVAVREPLARAAAGLAALLIADSVVSLEQRGGARVEFGNFVFGLLVGGAAWTGGRIVRSHSQRAGEHAAKAERLEAEQLTAVAEERARIARELHDVIAHSVSVMIVQAAAASEMLRHDEPERAARPLATVEETGRQALAEMGRLVGLLRADDEELGLAPQPSLDELDTLIRQVRDAGLPVELRIEGERRPVPPGVDLSAYRVLQEALTNALKHAGRASAQVLVRFSHDALELEILDDGAGRPNGRSEGNGLIGMHERVSVFGGEFAAGPRPEGGFSVRARLPLAGP
jgi:signal transduction histidine kinase